ncbi:hypothetical protein [Acrocarpospora sp. B8E8]|uniref:hypothetical protein n=1 Tax=Acrocarpospora sp. B8E8 TaxID=3153572 RepID=UPI00325F004E
MPRLITRSTDRFRPLYGRFLLVDAGDIPGDVTRPWDLPGQSLIEAATNVAVITTTAKNDPLGQNVADFVLELWDEEPPPSDEVWDAVEALRHHNTVGRISLGNIEGTKSAVEIDLGTGGDWYLRCHVRATRALTIEEYFDLDDDEDYMAEQFLLQWWPA